jgi:hypothetical protein
MAFLALINRNEDLIGTFPMHNYEISESFPGCFEALSKKKTGYAGLASRGTALGD